MDRKTPRTHAPITSPIPAEPADSPATEPGQIPPAGAPPDQAYRKACRYAAAHAWVAVLRSAGRATELDWCTAAREVLNGEDWTRFGGAPAVEDVLALMGPLADAGAAVLPQPAPAMAQKSQGPFNADTLPEFLDGFRGVDWSKCNVFPASTQWPLPGSVAGDTSCTFTPAMAALAERTAGVAGLLWYDKPADVDRPLAELTQVARPGALKMTTLRLGTCDRSGFCWPSCPDIVCALYIGCAGANGAVCLYVRFFRRAADPAGPAVTLQAPPIGAAPNQAYRKACRYAAAHAAAAIQRSPGQALDPATAVLDFMEGEDFTRFGGQPAVQDVLALMEPLPGTAAAVLLPSKAQECPVEPAGVPADLLPVPAAETPPTAPRVAPGVQLADTSQAAFFAACRRAADRARELLGLGGGPAGGSTPTGAGNATGHQYCEEDSEWEAMARLEDADPDSQFRSGILLERRKATISAMVVQVYGTEAVLPDWMQPEAGPVYIPDVERTGEAVPVEVTERDTGHLVVVVHLTRRGGVLQVHMPYRRADGSPAYMSCS